MEPTAGLKAADFATDALPVIDVAGLRSADRQDRKAVGREIEHACTDLGFMYVVGHGVSPSLRARVLEQAALFFDQDLETKMRLDMQHSSCNRGYEPMQRQTLEAGTPPDLKQGFYLGEDLPLDHPRVRAGSFNHGPNLWPEGLPDFRPVMEEYHAVMMELGALLMRGLALSLHLDEQYFDDFCIEPMVGLRLLHYPPQPANAAPDEKGCGAHTDWGGLTMLMQDQNGGLQVLGKDGTWFNAPPRADAYVVNLGDMIARWTNDRYRSTMHRVVNISGTERYSVPFFYTGAPDHRVEVLPSCLADGEVAKYPVTTVEQHIAEMYAKTYG